MMLHSLLPFAEAFAGALSCLFWIMAAVGQPFVPHGHSTRVGILTEKQRAVDFTKTLDRMIDQTKWNSLAAICAALAALCHILLLLWHA